MIVTAMPYQSPVTTVRRSDEPRDKPDAPDQVNDTTATQFAALLALLGGSNSKVRTELLKQVPAADNSLLDKLLAGATNEADVASAADAARYGMLLGSAAADVSAIVGAGSSNASSSTATSRISAEVLSRIASRKSASVENLLAMGDTNAAAAKARLDALLASVGLTNAASIAAANALAAALATSASNVTAPVTATDGLDPEFRARLEAVIVRMRRETGSEVSIVETVRSQERQDMLFAQGRTAPGDVVTWTQDSAHTRGRAADVIVDGSWNNQKGFDLLQQIAKEEGLRTLGARDPGHLELASDEKSVGVKAAVQPVGNNGVARVANVASVASVAPLGNASVTAVKIETPAATTNNAPNVLMAGAGRSANSPTASEDGSKEKSDRDRATSGTKTDVTDGVLLNEANRTASHKFIGPVDSSDLSAPVAGADGAERVQSIDALRERTSSAPMSQITLEVDGINGDKQQITVDMRGNTVGANITTDASSADRMRARVGDLHDALEGHGLQVDTVHISSPSRATDSSEGVKQVSGGEAIRLGGSSPTGSGEGSFQQGQRERSSATRDWEDRQAAREEQRRSGKQPPQDRQRPQYQEKQ